MLARAFQFDGITVRVASDDADSVRWLEEFLQPAFEVSDPGDDDAGQGDGGPGPSVRLTIDGEAFDRCARHIAEPPADTRACFALDTQITRHPARLVDERLVLVDEQVGCAYRLEERGVEIVAHPRSDKRRMPLMRAVREIAAEACRRRPGRLQLHASALASRGRGLLILGPKRAGKTTLLIHALRAPGAHFLSNDRVFASLEGERVVVRGMPTFVSIRADTLRRFPALREAIPEGGWLAIHTLRDLHRARENGPSLADGQRASISPPQLCALVGVGARATAPLDALVFPEIDDAVDRWDVEPLARSAARERLTACRYGHGTDRGERTVFEDLLGGEAADDEARNIESLLDRVPARLCRLGPQAYDDPCDASALLDALLDAPATASAASADSSPAGSARARRGSAG